MSDEAEHLNLQAYLALSNYHPDIAGALCALLESEWPIDPAVRAAMALAIRKTKADDGIRLEIAGEGKGRKDNPARFVHTRKRWIEAGRYIQQRIDEGSTIESAKFDCGRFGLSFSQAGTAWAYYLAAQQWITERVEFRQGFERLTSDPDLVDEMMLGLYHGLNARAD